MVRMSKSLSKEPLMSIQTGLDWISVGTLLFYAIASAILPHFVARNLEHTLPSGRGVSEFRILHGGFFGGLALFALFANNPLVFQAMGFGWLGAALIRIPAYFPDRPTWNLSFAAFIGELILGLILLI